MQCRCPARAFKALLKRVLIYWTMMEHERTIISNAKLIERYFPGRFLKCGHHRLSYYGHNLFSVELKPILVFDSSLCVFLTPCKLPGSRSFGARRLRQKFRKLNCKLEIPSGEAKLATTLVMHYHLGLASTNRYRLSISKENNAKIRKQITHLDPTPFENMENAHYLIA